MKRLSQNRPRTSREIILAYAVLVVLLPAVVYTDVPTSFESCLDFENANFQVDMVMFSAEPREGEKFKILQTGKVLKDTVISKLELQIFQGEIQIQDDTQTREQFLKANKFGSVEYDYTAPESVPSGEYIGKILMFNSIKTLLVCYQFKMDFKDPAKIASESYQPTTH